MPSGAGESISFVDAVEKPLSSQFIDTKKRREFSTPFLIPALHFGSSFRPDSLIWSGVASDGRVVG
jgi:hypothetical protein